MLESQEVDKTKLYIHNTALQNLNSAFFTGNIEHPFPI